MLVFKLIGRSGRYRILAKQFTKSVLGIIRWAKKVHESIVTPALSPESKDNLHSIAAVHGRAYVRIFQNINLKNVPCMAKVARFIIHGLGTANALYADYHFTHYAHVPDEPFYKAFIVHWGPRNFLTSWNLGFQGLFFFLCLINDIFGSNDLKHRPLIRRIVDFMFCSVVFPIGMFIGICFWTLFTFDRKLVYPEELDLILPVWFNHLMHTNILIFIIAQMCLCYNKSTSHELLALYLIKFSYIGCLLYVYYFEGVWIYPLFEVLNWPARILFLASSCLLAHAFLFAGKFTTNYIWGETLEKIKQERWQKSS